jgi:adenylate cyclase
MSTQEFKRKLTAILSADVEGYSRLMGQDEEARIEAAEALRASPKFTLVKFKKRLTYKKKADRDQFLGALHKAGLK